MNYRLKSGSKTKKKEKAIALFTGGVDSFYTLLTSHKSIDAILFVINYDVGEKKPYLLHKQLETLKLVSNKFEKELIISKSNHWDLIRQKKINYLPELSKYHRGDIWGKFLHGPALISHAYNLSNDFNKLFIPSTHDPKFINFLWGSLREIDPLYSSEDLEIVHHGDCGRFEKIKKILQIDKSLIFKNLKVCYKNPDQIYNCSSCRKCIQTLISIELINPKYLENLETFSINKSNYLELKEEYLKNDFTDDENSKFFQDEIKKYL